MTRRGALALVFSSAAWAQSDWTMMGRGGSVESASAAMTFHYEIAPAKMSAAVRPTPGGVARDFRIRFRIRSDHDTPIGVLLSERKPGGGDYAAIFWSPANAWQQVELNAADFALNDGPNDPADADGKLDSDQVQAIGIFDFAGFIASAPPNPNLFIDRPSGARTISVEDFEITSAPAARETRVIDRFDRGFLQWLTMGGIRLKLAPASPLGGPALEASYEPPQGQISILIRRLGSIDLSGATHLAFDVASEQETTLMVALEQKSARFHLTIFPPAGRKIFHVDLSLADFEPDEGSAARKPDPTSFKSISLADVSAMEGGAAAPNTIWIGNMRTLWK